MNSNNPDRNCGLCGFQTCHSFQDAVSKEISYQEDCPFHQVGDEIGVIPTVTSQPKTDFHGNPYDFILRNYKDEPSARKIIQPFRVDLIEKLDIRENDVVMGRPIGAGCPVYHVLRVMNVDVLTGLLSTWVVGPLVSRTQEAKDIGGYKMVGFEGFADDIQRMPEIGKQANFLPGFCMIRLNHKGLVNVVLQKKAGLLVRIEDIHISDSMK